MRFLISAIVALIFTSCHIFEDISVDSKRVIVVLLDLSGSTLKARDDYIKPIEKIFSSLSYGDYISILLVDSRSELQVSPLFEDSIPAIKAKNKFYLNLTLDIDSLDLIKANMLNRFMKVFNNSLKGMASKNTRIMGAIYAASKILLSFEKEKILVIISDMIEDSEYNLINLKEEDFERVIKKEFKSGRIPNLNGVTVYIVTVGLDSAGEFYRLMNFWEKYFKMANAKEIIFDNFLTKLKTKG